ncbi:acid protease [Trametes versicolor FP-101664 SS1]|uniref:acid protease n=1 Tax=Trametes versicolor (strain FP-101664) TaxID=717944 RepID=UPI000462276F|nr:acid protease [Trametes versicolor FP-101664 SS1]EIW57421.1 acid protease [Trametes versicolor FP-101664 SS1]
MPALPLSLVSLMGGVLSSFLFPAAVFSKPTSFSVSTRSGGVQFVDGPLTADNIGIHTADNTAYFTDITLGGVNLTVVFDTGSSDLLVILQGRDINLTNSTDVQTSEAFGLGAASGTIKFADLQLGDSTVKSQAFLDVTQTQDFGNSQDGIIGMSFNAPSAVLDSLAKAFGQDAAAAIGGTPMPALFAQQPDLQKSFDVVLGRADGLGDPAQGTFLIGAHDETFNQQVSAAPQLTSVSGDHWSAVLDSMNINGKPFQFNASRIQGVPEGKVAAVLDTGFSFPPLPAPAVDAIYSTIEGAVFDRNHSFWIVPCTASANLSFVFGGQEFLVHPLDITFPTVGPFTGDPTTNVTVCINTFQYLTLDPTQFVGFDIILGDAFLRNAYSSFNYGDGVTGPFMQLVSTTTDANAALQEFQTQRAATLAKLPPAVDPASVANKEGQHACGDRAGPHMA